MFLWTNLALRQAEHDATGDNPRRVVRPQLAEAQAVQLIAALRVLEHQRLLLDRQLHIRLALLRVVELELEDVRACQWCLCRLATR